MQCFIVKSWPGCGRPRYVSSPACAAEPRFRSKEKELEAQRSRAEQLGEAQGARGAGARGVGPAARAKAEDAAHRQVWQG